MSLFGAFSRKSRDEPARSIYVAIVDQARQPGFYLRCGVPDTPDGRFDMIVLHAFLLLRRLKREPERTAELGQAVFDLMFADMDQNLREMGIGDLSVGKRVKAMAAAFYGRVAAYEAGLENGDSALAEALRRNLYRKASPAAAEVMAVVAYMRREAAALDATTVERLTAGGLAFGPAPAPETR